MSQGHTADLGRRCRQLLRRPAARATLALIGAICGGGLVLLTMAVGHCASFGGLCPAEPVPWWQDDVLGSTAAGLVLMVATPVLARWPSRRGLVVVAASLAVVLPVAWLIAEVLRTGGT